MDPVLTLKKVFRKLVECSAVEWLRRDYKSQCPAVSLEGVLTPAESWALVGAAEKAAASLGGYVMTRHQPPFQTRDLPIKLVLDEGFETAEARSAAAATYERALATISDGLAKHCDGATDLAVSDGFVIRYEDEGAPPDARGHGPQPDLPEHTDASYFSATLLLSPGDQVGRSDAHVLEQTRASSSSSSSEKKKGPSTVLFRGGGTRFGAPPANYTIFPDQGGSTIHGGGLRHAALPVTQGRRYVLALFLKPQHCALGPEALEHGLFLVLTALGAAFLAYLALVADFG